ncbi:YheT family hydrolase [Rhodoferax aquaticus]|uniref:Alpha/beta fold hydrolase n=1 Tax=Rhodoferax aquaticus TaxID=2527691 RepID=A0A515EUD4_9BURK|nr:alpha/beta fold hydrolase [Rhodoferax aquaticus]QDL56290.1 alpha/beta fold hydrolase [Rhodoferax aquaticus]
MKYVAPCWLPGGNLQTIWPALFSSRFVGDRPLYVRQRWHTPDRDFIDVDWLSLSNTEPRPSVLLVLFHGLEGSSRSHYAEAFASVARAHRMDFAVPHFRGCSGELNQGPRAYHSGDHQEIAWILEELQKRHQGPILAVGVSLGGNALLRWAQEQGNQAAHTVSACVAISAPLDLAASGQAIARGFNRVYTNMFLRTMKPKALLKLNQHPGLFDRSKLMGTKTLYEFDNVFTAPLHGFKDTEDYWLRASAKPRMQDIQVPTLVINAKNDPFVPAACLPTQKNVGRHVTLWQPSDGGHVGFPRGRPPAHVMEIPELVIRWCKDHLPVVESAYG